jgi:hypothetical protein
MEQSRRPDRGWRALPLWAGLVLLFVGWQAFDYQWLVERAGEWEYDRFGFYVPAATALLFVVLFAAPVIFVLFPRRRYSVGRRRILTVVLSVIAAGCLISAIAAGVMAFLGGRMTAAPQSVVLNGSPVTDIHSGPTRLQGQVRADRRVEHRVNLFFSDRTLRYAPVEVPGRATSQLRFFVATEGASARRPGEPLTGLLRRGALPGDVEELYQRTGFSVAKPHWVLFTDPAQYRWPYIVLAIKLALVSLLLGIAANVEYRRLRTKE